jgi:hypothetical protein
VPIYQDAEEPYSPILGALGQIVTHWSFGEAVVEDLIAGFLGANVRYVYPVTANINISTRCQSVKALAKLRLEAFDLAEFESALEQFEDLIPFRNKLIHGLWSDSDFPDIVLVSLVKSRGTARYQSEYVNLVYLQWLGRQIQRTALLLLHFGKRHGLIMSSST